MVWTIWLLDALAGAPQATLQPGGTTPSLQRIARLEAQGLHHTARSLLWDWVLHDPDHARWERAVEALTIRIEAAGAPLTWTLEPLAAASPPRRWSGPTKELLAYHGARYLLRQGALQPAREHLGAPNTHRALWLSALLHLDNPKIGTRELHAALQAGRTPDERDLVRLTEGRALYRWGLHDTALERFASIRPSGAHGEDAALGAAWCQLRLDRPEDAERWLQGADPDSPETMYLSLALSFSRRDLAASGEAVRALAQAYGAAVGTLELVGQHHGEHAWRTWLEHGSTLPRPLRLELQRATHADATAAMLEQLERDHRRISRRPRHRDLRPGLQDEASRIQTHAGDALSRAARARVGAWRRWAAAAEGLALQLDLADGVPPTPR